MRDSLQLCTYGNTKPWMRSIIEIRFNILQVDLKRKWTWAIFAMETILGSKRKTTTMSWNEDNKNVLNMDAKIWQPKSL